MTTIQLVREEIHAITKEIKQSNDSNRVRALGDVLEKLNARYERLERELLEEEPAENVA